MELAKHEFQPHMCLVHLAYPTKMIHGPLNAIWTDSSIAPRGNLSMPPQWQNTAIQCSSLTQSSVFPPLRQVHLRLQSSIHSTHAFFPPMQMSSDNVHTRRILCNSKFQQTQFLECILGLHRGSVKFVLRGPHSLLLIPDVDDGGIRGHHASLDDFLPNPAHAGRFYLSYEVQHADLVRCCLSIIINSIHSPEQYAAVVLVFRFFSFST